jgi:hypothetical protein
MQFQQVVLPVLSRLGVSKSSKIQAQYAYSAEVKHDE